MLTPGQTITPPPSQAPSARDQCAVQDDRSVVDEAARAHPDGVAVVALQRRQDLGVVTKLAQQRSQQLHPLLLIGHAGGVEALDQQPAPLTIGRQLRVVGEVPVTPQHPVLLITHRVILAAPRGLTQPR
jgi:hypothetical protein